VAGKNSLFAWIGLTCGKVTALKWKAAFVGRLLIFVIILFFSALVLYSPPFLQSLEQMTFDLRFKMRGVMVADDRIVIVALDEKTFWDQGVWPLPRETMASLIDRITSMEPKVIAIDMLFSERRDTGLSAGDAALQAALERAGNVVLSFAFDIFVKGQETKRGATLAGAGPPARNRTLPDALPPEAGWAPTEKIENRLDFLQNAAYNRIKKVEGFFVPIRATRVLPPLKIFAESAAALGHASILTDQDQVLRREILAVEYHEEYYPPMSIQAAGLYLGLHPIDLVLQMGEAVHLGKIKIPIDEGGRMLINYLGPAHTFPHYSASDLLNNQLQSSLFHGKVVLVGVTALGHGERKESPFSAMDGIEKNANAISTILSQRFLYRTEAMKLFDIALIMFYGVILWQGLPRLRPLGSIFLGIALPFAHLALAILLFNYGEVWIYIVYPVGAIVSTSITYTASQYCTQEREARRIRKMFSSYVSPRVVEEMTRRPDLTHVGGEMKEVTILFSDIKGFTPYCERHAPAKVVDLLNRYLEAMTEVTFHWEGTLDKFVGDAIMVYWGAPLPQDNHAERAIRCALQMQDRLLALRKKWEAAGIEPFEIGIGINTGEVIVGNIGVEGKKMDYTVIGDAVNVAARTESLTRQFNLPLMITEQTYLHVKGLLDINWAGSTLVAGRQQGRIGQNKIGRIIITPFKDVQLKGKKEGIDLFGIRGIPRVTLEGA